MRYYRAMYPEVLHLESRPSSSLAFATVLAHGLAAWAVWLAGLPVGVQLVLALAILTSLVVFWRRRTTVGLRAHADGRLEIRQGDRWLDVQPGADSLVWPWLALLRGKIIASGVVVSVATLGDSLSPDDFRRWRVWLRWRARPDAPLTSI